MRTRDIFPAWGRILTGYTPFLSIEITKECPLRCPGCYAYNPGHLGNGATLRELSDYRGDELVSKVFNLVHETRPLHISIIGGEPLVRYRELDQILHGLDKMGIEVQLVTSAVRHIPGHWAKLECLHVVVSIDGLQPEHDKRRAPATYARILQHIAGHRITVHCTLTRQVLGRTGYLEEFCDFWSARPEVHKIWFSLYTPQEGEVSEERLTAEDRRNVLTELVRIRGGYPKLQLSDPIVDGYARPPQSPEECIFARVTTCLTADMNTAVSPCQFGGRPVCSECGCLASAGMASIGRYRLAGLIPLASIFAASNRIGRVVRSRAHNGNSNGNGRGGFGQGKDVLTQLQPLDPAR
ncbi:MAG: radical SAM protein [Bryobacteraceae bacterium]|nr:radical SAM protein [Bryobacterales bacterium]MEB2364346.1 radical SAM protein [Bryobacterales bacterium]NUN00669.1 radical SAM protein [Bryobacteraceae bacterium]